MRKEKSCGVIVFRKHNGERLYLVLKQLKNHKWSFPKGHRRFYESEMMTAMREVKEESGTKPMVVKNFRETVEYYPKEDVHKTVVFFVGEVFDDLVVVQKGEIAEYKWLNFKDAYTQITFPDFREVLKKADKFLDETENGKRHLNK